MQKKYFGRANTSSGCVNLMMNNLKNIKNLYILEGSSKALKAQILKELEKRLGEKYRTECAVSPFDIRSYDAIIVRELGFAAVDRACLENTAEGKIINTDKFLVKKIDTEYLLDLEKRAEEAYNGLYAAYGKGKVVHDEWEQVYVQNINFDRLNSYCEGVISQLVGSKRGNGGRDNYERFFGASTPDGSVNYIDNITQRLEKRYFIKGRPGTGKSTFLKKLAKAAQGAGFDTELYYCSFDKNSLDMTLIPELSLCVFDSTAPHEMFPAGDRDSILDFYAESGLEGVDEKYEKELDLISRKYRYRIAEGTAHLRLGNLFAAEREFYLERASDLHAAAAEADKIICEICK